MNKFDYNTVSLEQIYDLGHVLEPNESIRCFAQL